MSGDKNAVRRRQKSLKYELIDLLKEAGHHLGLTPVLVDHLCYLIDHTQVQDWQGENRAIVYKAVTTMALDKGISERQIFNREKALAEVLGLFIVGAGNHRRYGTRDPITGQLVRAFGIELTPLRAFVPVLRQIVANRAAEKAAWFELKNRLEIMRREIRKLTHAVLESGQSEILSDLCSEIKQLSGRITARTMVAELRNRLQIAQQIKLRLEDWLLSITCGQAVDISDQSEIFFTYKDTIRDSYSDSNESDCRGLWTNQSTDLSPDSVDKFKAPQRDQTEKSSDPALSLSVDGYLCRQGGAVSGTDKGLSLDRVLGAASREFVDALPYGSERLTEADIIAQAVDLLPDLGITPSAWAEACQIIGAWPAAVCVVLADQRARAGTIRNPGGYVRAMARRALSGDLRLSASVWGGLS